MARTPTHACRAAVLEAQENGACHASSTTSEQRQLNRMTKRGELVSPLQGIFASASWWADLNPNERAIAQIRGLAKKHPDWIFCDMSAALVHGLWVSYEESRDIHVLTHRKAPAKNKGGVTWHVSASLEYEEVNDIRVTPFVRTVFDCCRRYPVRKCLGVADSALRLANKDAAWLKEAFEGFSRQTKGWRQAKIVASLANPLAENGGESIARATMIKLGFETPQLQVEVPNVIDGGTYRVDFLWRLADDTVIAGELDGREKYSNPIMTMGRDATDVLADERLRESRINALKIPVARFSMNDVKNEKRFECILDAFGVPRVKRKAKRKVDTSLPLNWQVLKLDGWVIEYEVIDKRAA